MMNMAKKAWHNEHCLVVVIYIKGKPKRKIHFKRVLEFAVSKNINFLLLDDGVYVPTYTRTKFTDDLHRTFKFSTNKSVFTKKSTI